MSLRTASIDRLQALKEAGAPAWDPVGWHYLQTLAARTAEQSGLAQNLLNSKLEQALHAFEARRRHAEAAPTPINPASSPLALLLQEMQSSAARSSAALPPENPRVKQFRQQLRKISMQKQVRHALAQAPQNAGPINSQMLVLRALDLMRSLSPAYLHRFMTHLDTLLCLEEAEKKPLTPKRATPPTKKKR